MKLTSLGFLLVVFSGCVYGTYAQKVVGNPFDTVIVELATATLDSTGHYPLGARAVTKTRIECGWQTNKKLELRGNLAWQGARNEHWNANKRRLEIRFFDVLNKDDVLETAPLEKGKPIPCHAGTWAEISLFYEQNPPYGYGPRPGTLTSTLTVYSY